MFRKAGTTASCTVAIMNYVQSVDITMGYKCIVFSYFSHVSFKIYLCTANWYLEANFLSFILS